MASQQATSGDSQTLTLTSPNLTIENGNLVDLSSLLDNTDEQTLSLLGSVLGISNGNTVDLTPFLDNTDSNVSSVTASLAGTVLTLNVTEDGNTVSDTVDLASLLDNTDEQTLSLAGTTLNISGGNSVDLSGLLDDTDVSDVSASLTGTVLTVSVVENGDVSSGSVNLLSLLDNTDNQTLSLPANSDTLSISGGNNVDLSRYAHQEATIYVEEFAGGSSNGQQSGAWTRNATVARTAGGRWTVTFASPHPDGVDYNPSFSWEESGTARRNPKIGIVQGSKTANGFNVMITVDDNGGTADVYSDQPWSFGVTAPRVVLIPA